MGRGSQFFLASQFAWSDFIDFCFVNFARCGLIQIEHAGAAVVDIRDRVALPRTLLSR